MQRKIIFLLILSFILTSSLLFAGTTGKLAGKVKDQDGNPVPFANVILIGFEVGAQTYNNGQFVIINITPGTYDIQISRGGFHTQRINGVKIILDETTIQNVVLKKTAIAIDGIDVVEARHEMVNKGRTSSVSTITSDTIEEIAVDNIVGIIAIQAGAIVVGGDLHIRGGRPNEVVFSIDGMSVSDPVDGGAALTIDRDAIKDMKVMTGGFSAEFGNAQSGVVNIITKDGGKDYSGKMEFTSDHLLGENVTNSNSDVVKLALGGPVLGPLSPGLRDKFTFFFNGAANWHDSFYNEQYNINPNDEIPTLVSSWRTYEPYDPYKDRGDFWIFDLGDRNYNNYNANFKTKYTFNPTQNVTFAVRGNTYYNEPFAHAWKYALEHYAKTEGGQRQYITTYNHVFNPKMNLVVRASYYQKNVEQGPRDITRDMYFVQDSVNFELIGNLPGQCSGIIYLTDDGIIGDTEEYNWTYETGDGEEERIPFVRPGTIFGSYFDDENSEIAFKSDFEYQVNPVHGLKSGFEVKKHHIKKDRLFNPWEIYQIRYDNYLNDKVPEVAYSAGDTIWDNGVPFVLTDTLVCYSLLDIYNATLSASGLRDGYEADPWQGAFYIQDRMEWEGMIVNAGIRLDIWYLGGDYDIVTPQYTGSYLNSINPDSEMNSIYYLSDADPDDDPVNYKKYHDAKDYYQKIKDRFEAPEIMVSPRLGVSHPISERSVLHFAYNYQRQLPQMQYIFTTGRPQDVIENPSANIIVGNPELDAQSTITYEAGLQYQLSEDYVLDITAYYKNIYNYVSTKEVTDETDPNLKWNEYVSEDYGSARGIDLNIQKMLSNFFSGSVSYSLTWANGNHSETNTANLESLREFPLNWDIRNSFNLNFLFKISKGEEFYIPFTDVILPLDNFTANFTYNLSSGVPFTEVDEYNNLQEQNAEQQPYTETANLRVRKNFTFGEKTKLSLYMDIDNLFNKRNYWNVYAKTGSPYYSGNDLDFNNDDYVDDETTSVYQDFDRNPRNYSIGRSYTFGLAFSW